MKTTPKNLPDEPGVYFFLKKGKILYIGKATSLRSRVKSYFSKDLVLTRGNGIVKMVADATNVDFKTTPSVLEALILEASLIKKHQPPYNIREKDDKSFNFVVISDERFPQIQTMRGKELLFQHSDVRRSVSNIKIKKIFGPFPNGRELQEALKLVRKIFPYRGRKCVPFDPVRTHGPQGDPTSNGAGQTKSASQRLRPCFERQIGLCPGVCTGEIDARQYAHVIRNISLLFEGKTEKLLKQLTREMNRLARLEKFEEATKLRNQIFSLTHIKDISLIKDQVNTLGRNFRIESYDVSHISGTNTVGAMVVIENGYPAKNEYRKFIMRGAYREKAHDLANLKEILERRLKHPEWPPADLVVVDGGEVHRAFAEKLLRDQGLAIPVVSVVKDEKHKPRDILGESKIVHDYRREIVLANSEAHRFAIQFHRAKRDKVVQ